MVKDNHYGSMEDITLPLFEPLQGGRVILRSRGIFKEAKLFTHGGIVYAREGSGFVQLRANNETSRDRLYWGSLQLAEKTELVRGVLYLVKETL